MTSAYYRNWSNARDKALENIHRRCQKEISDLARRSFLNIVNATASYLAKMTDDIRYTTRGRSVLYQVNAYIDTELHYLANVVMGPVDAMRGRTLKLTHASELEVLARLKDATITGDPPAAGNNSVLYSRILAALNRLGDRIKEEIERGYVNAWSTEEIVAAVKSKLPKPVRYVRPPRELKPFREAIEPTEFNVDKPKAQASLSFISEDDWTDIINSYKKDYVPKFRGPEYVFDRDIGEPELEEWFAWEVEQEVAQDFCEQVKAGTVQAANEAGVDDFLWVAILDDKTRPEHRAKHGLTSSEIEAKLENEWSDFEDQTTIPPGGFNCRCRAAPYEKDLPEAPKFQYEDFDTWVTT